MCLYSKLIINPKYTATKKNGGIIPPMVDERVKYVPIGCGKCIECRKQKAREWQVRLLEDIKTNKLNDGTEKGKPYFITLTFSDESIAELAKEIKGLDAYNLDNAIATLGIRRFLERYRKEHKKSLRHWLVSELGHNGTENIHLHGIIWTKNTIENIRKHWQYGFMWPRPDTKENYVNAKTVNYIVKYVNKQDEDHPNYKSIILTSAGIGQNYTNTNTHLQNKYKGEKTIETYRTTTGHKIAMPIYWRNKIYTDQEKEQLWLQKLNKEERWICGEKITIKQGEEAYYKLLQYHRNKNRELGYGDDEKNWELELYEKQRRNIQILTRIKKGEAKKANALKGNATVRPAQSIA